MVEVAVFIACYLAGDQAQGNNCSRRSAELMVVLLAGAGPTWQTPALLGARRALRATPSDLHPAREGATRRRADTR